MAFRIEEHFQVEAAVDTAWSLLTRPDRLVHCLPGAELTETLDDGSFAGRLRLKVGPITNSFRGTARFTRIDEASHSLELAGEARETGGAGSARMTITCHVQPVPAGSDVTVVVDLELAGRIVQFGRGMIAHVSQQLFGQFAGCIRAQLNGQAATLPAGAATPHEPAVSATVVVALNPSAESRTQTLPAAPNPPAVPLDLLALIRTLLRNFLRRLFRR